MRVSGLEGVRISESLVLRDPITQHGEPKKKTTLAFRNGMVIPGTALPCTAQGPLRQDTGTATKNYGTVCPGVMGSERCHDEIAECLKRSISWTPLSEERCNLLARSD